MMPAHESNIRRVHMSSRQTIFRTVDTANDRYTIVSNDLIKHNAVSGDARMLLIYLLSKPDDWTVRRTDLMRSMDCGETVIRRCLGELRDWGYLRYDHDTQDDGKHVWITTVHDKPLPGQPDERRRTTGGYKESVDSSGGKSTSRNSTSGKSTCRESTSRKPATLVSTDVVSTDVVSTDVVNTDVVNAPSDKETDQKNEDKPVYTDEFNKMWDVYPRQISRKKAMKAWNKRVKEGHSTNDMLSAARNYASEAKKQRTEIKYLQHPSTFFGPDEPFTDYVSSAPNVDSKVSNVIEDRSGESGEVDVKDLLGETF